MKIHRRKFLAQMRIWRAKGEKIILKLRIFGTGKPILEFSGFIPPGQSDLTHLWFNVCKLVYQYITIKFLKIITLIILLFYITCKIQTVNTSWFKVRHNKFTFINYCNDISSVYTNCYALSIFDIMSIKLTVIIVPFMVKIYWKMF